MVEAAPCCALLGGFAIAAQVALLWQHNANPSYKHAYIPRYDDTVRTACWAESACAAVGWRGRSQNCAPYMESGRGWLAGDWPSTGGVLNITAVAWTAGFLWWRSGNKKRTQNVSEYMLVLALCLVITCAGILVNVKYFKQITAIIWHYWTYNFNIPTTQHHTDIDTCRSASNRDRNTVTGIQDRRRSPRKKQNNSSDLAIFKPKIFKMATLFCSQQSVITHSHGSESVVKYEAASQ